MMKWEYKYFDFAYTYGDPTARLNEYGEEGWELVSVAPSGAEHLLEGKTLHFLFKRPKE